MYMELVSDINSGSAAADIVDESIFGVEAWSSFMGENEKWFAGQTITMFLTTLYINQLKISKAIPFFFYVFSQF